LAGWQLSRKSTFSSNGDIEIHYTPRNTGFEPPPETESRLTRNAQADQTKLAEKILKNDFHTMRDVLSSIAGFSISKLRKKLPKKAYLGKSAAIQLAHEGSIDLETPDSILGQVNCRSLLNKATFLRLPPEYQFKLSKLLPPVDRSGSKVSHSSFNNEFFAKASQEWKERLLRGDFTGKAH
jgi:additional sex combs-like protein